MAWLDPMCGLMLAFITAASVWRRRTGVVARVDFSMIEAMLWTMAEPLLQEQVPEMQVSEPGVVRRCDGPDDWLSVGPVRAPMSGDYDSPTDAAVALARSVDLVDCPHLGVRGFWDAYGSGVVPGLPWRASFGRASGSAPDLGADTEAVLSKALGMQAVEIAALRNAGVFG